MKHEWKINQPWRKKNSGKRLLNSEKESYSFLIKEEIILEMTS